MLVGFCSISETSIWIWKETTNTFLWIYSLCPCSREGDRKAKWNKSTQSGQWTNACQHCWTWHVRNTSYVPSINSFLVHHHSLFQSPTSARILSSFSSLLHFTKELVNLRSEFTTFSLTETCAWLSLTGKKLLWSPMYSNCRYLK